MAVAEIEIQWSSWEVLDTCLKMHKDNFPYGGINVRFTESLRNTYLENYEQNVNRSMHFGNLNNSFKDIVLHCNIPSIFALYPSGILWFGAICFIFFAIFGTFGNLISALALVSCKRPRNATTAFIVNLCVADMLNCAFTMPLTAMTFIHREWRYGDALCKASALAKMANAMLSVFTLVAIAINRYIIICHPRIYKTVYSRRNTGISIAVLWLFPIGLMLPPLFDVWGTLTFNPLNGDCGVNNLHGTSPRALIFAAIIVVPSIIFTACYLRIYFVVKNSIGSKRKQDSRLPECSIVSRENSEEEQKNMDPGRGSKLHVDLSDKKEFRVLRIVLVIFIFYTASIFPISLIKLCRKEPDLQVLNVLAYIFYFAASVVNPIIYIVMSKEYRMAYKGLFASKGILGGAMRFSTSTAVSSSV